MKDLRGRRVREFLGRLDRHLSRAVPRWAAVEAGQRAAMLERAVEHARREGITEEIYIAQFVVLYMVGGAALFASDAARGILASGLEPRIKVYQLMALAGIDVAATIEPRPGASARERGL